jgi:predicted nucleic acid-binding protein
MRARSCTIDSSCVIALDHLDLLPQLSLLFSTVLVPKAVRDELFRRRTTKDRVQLLFERYAFVQPCDRCEQGVVDFHLAERSRQGNRDRGGVEAVVQAAQFGASVIVDDPWGRELAARSDLEFHGTLWVLERFHELDLLHSAALRESLISLRGRGIRLPWEAANMLLTRIGQERI